MVIEKGVLRDGGRRNAYISKPPEGTEGLLSTSKGLINPHTDCPLTIMIRMRYAGRLTICVNPRHSPIHPQ